MGASAVVPSASAQGCTEVFLDAASNPESDATVLAMDIKHPENGIYVNPLNAPERIGDYAAHEWAALSAYIECVV